ncbi:hypothetical protein GCM10022226_46780 [Sphaerisporangium flaviroseum]|uniref:Uncharacterized protein n=1 Tax=Sphaerisporangium flaviroseum TaxID=509199 RepID=A0ABP7IL25_9ACTN
MDEAEFLSRVNSDDAIRAYHAFYEVKWDTAYVQKIGCGQNRTAYLVGGIVYKVDGWLPENLHDHRMLQAARQSQMPWAPPSALFELEDRNGRKKYVMAMPYFVNDGSAPDPEAMALMRMQTNNQLDDTNYRVVGGKPVVIDAGDIEKHDLGFCQRPTAFDRYGRPTTTCRAPAVVIRPNHLVRLLCAACASTCT